MEPRCSDGRLTRLGGCVVEFREWSAGWERRARVPSPPHSPQSICELGGARYVYSEVSVEYVYSEVSVEGKEFEYREHRTLSAAGADLSLLLPFTVPHARRGRAMRGAARSSHAPGASGYPERALEIVARECARPENPRARPVKPR